MCAKIYTTERCCLVGMGSDNAKAINRPAMAIAVSHGFVIWQMSGRLWQE